MPTCFGPAWTIIILCICWEITANITENARNNTRKEYINKYIYEVNAYPFVIMYIIAVKVGTG
jgi:hypothetical protein